jgi:hypothetical protein
MGRKPKAATHAHADEPDGCGVACTAAEAMPDHALPPAAGGVANLKRARPAGRLEAIDGCDLDFSVEPTRDEDLPAATGGVARRL